MAVNTEVYQRIKNELQEQGVTLVAVSKTKPVSDIQQLYELGHRDFGENYVQELADKQALLPPDTRWHFIGHLQTNKVKYIVPFVHLIHGVDSFKLLKEINKQSQKINRVVHCLLQVHIAQEETKFGLDENELQEIARQEGELSGLNNVLVAGLMGMASFTDDTEKIRNEFRRLHTIFMDLEKYKGPRFQPGILSMGMSADYKIAVQEGSNLVRVGSLLFGERDYPTS